MNRKKQIGERIKTILEIKQWTQARLAQETKLPPSYIHRIVKGEQNMNLETIEKLESALEFKLIAVVE